MAKPSRSSKSPKPRAKLAVRLRRERVETCVRELGWSHELAVELAQKTGWSVRTIYRDYNDLVASLVEEEQAELPKRRAAFLLDLRALRVGATKSGAYAPAAKLLSLEGTILGLDRVPLPEPEMGDGGPVDTSLEGVLAEVRRMRLQAQAGHSYVAAERLLQKEADLTLAIRQREEDEARKKRLSMGEDELYDAVFTAIRGLPDQLRRRLKAELEE